MQVFYRVRSGETVSQIAERWGIPAVSIIAANHLSPPYLLLIGQQLSIPMGINAYRVRSGDTIEQISRLFGVPSTAIAEANQLSSPYLIHEGQLLTIPQGLPYYVVQPGDTLSNIARRFNVTLNGKPDPESIRRMNRLPSTIIIPGQRLTIPFAKSDQPGAIAYTANINKSYDIWIFHPKSGVKERLTNGLGETFSQPFWSPDRKKIAFIGKDHVLYIVYTDTNLIAAVDRLEARSYLDWSPNSRRIAYVTRESIVLYDVVSHDFDRIRMAGVADVNWFPSGTELLFEAKDAGGISQLFLIGTNGRGQQQVTKNTEGPVQHVRLSPDGNFALYTTPGASISIIYTVEISTGQVHEVKGGPLGKNYYPEWSPDSSQIAYCATISDDRGYFSQIRTVGRRGEGERIWAISNCYSTPVTWSPDGTELAYLSGCKEQEFASEMWGISLQHPVPFRLIEGVPIMSIQWSPSPESMTKTYSNNQYKIQFQYPSDWKKVRDVKYQGPNGFFQISAITGGSLEEVCHNEAFHGLLPYGTTPQIIRTQIQNEPACFVLPSQNQPVIMEHQSALIVRYPRPVEIGGETYPYFILWADREHIQDFAKTLIFLP